MAFAKYFNQPFAYSQKKLKWHIRENKTRGIPFLFYSRNSTQNFQSSNLTYLLPLKNKVIPYTNTIC